MEGRKSVSFFKLIDRIGEGGFGDVWRVKSTEDSCLYAMKVEPIDSKKRTLEFESNLMKKLQKCDKFPRLVLDGTDDKVFFLVMELCGPNLSVITEKLPEHFFKKEYMYKLGDDLLSCIEAFHLRGYVHRDIKPQNFVVRIDGSFPFCLIDYGISKLYTDPSGKHLEAREHVAVAGSPLFASPHNHERIELSRRDDLYSWLYTLISISEIGLPWSTSDGIENIGILKHQHLISQIIAPLGDAFVKIAEHVESLGFTDAPNYQMMHELLQKNTPETEAAYQWMTVPSESKDSESHCFDPSGFLLSIAPFLKQEKKSCRIS